MTPLTRVIHDHCPDCGSALVADPGFARWCAGCAWNIDPGPAEATGRPSPIVGWAHRLRARVAQRLVLRMYDQLDRPDVRPHRSAVTFIRGVGAILVHLITLGLLAGAGWAAVASFPNPFVLLLAAALIGLTVLVRPRYGRLTATDLVLDRAAAPALFGLLDRIAAAAGGRPVQRVRLGADFNATYGAFGLRNTRVMTIGLPLWRSLTPAQRVAVLGHELGHDVNGDFRHLTLATTALTTLRRAFHQPSEATPTAPAGLAGTVAFWLTYAVTWSMRSLDCRTAQRAEYLADAVATRVAGTDAVCAALDVIGTRGELVGTALGRSARQAATPAEMWAALDAELAVLPERELKRRRRAAAHRELRIDVHHPPVHLRVARVCRLPRQVALVEIVPAEQAAIEAELAGGYDLIGARIAGTHTP
ncbi:MAG: M48 family metallopeptidase [Sporichthyaceae bacterium]|nr:M48 family metallopeptidase [Sporichthyaceae bacterium]